MGHKHTPLELLNRAKQAAEYVCPDCNVELIADQYVDPALVFDNRITITWAEDDPLGSDFIVGRIISYPGSFYEPPSEDFDPIEGEPPFTKFDDALTAALKHVLLWRLDDLQQAEAEAKENDSV